MKAFSASHETRLAAARIATTLICATSVTALWVDDPGLAKYDDETQARKPRLKASNFDFKQYLHLPCPHLPRIGFPCRAQYWHPCRIHKCGHIHQFYELCFSCLFVVVDLLAIWLSIAYCSIGKILATLVVRHNGENPISRAIPAIFLSFLGLSSK